MSSAILIGSPNSGKSLLFNRLTGLNQKVANFPGITVDITAGEMPSVPGVTLLDFPGAYSLHAISEEERVTADNFSRLLEDDELGLVMCIIDATRLEKSLHFALQVVRECRRHDKPVIMLANMVDVLRQHDAMFDGQALAEAIGVPVVMMSGRSGEGLDELQTILRTVAGGELPPAVEPSRRLESASDDEIRRLSVQLTDRFATHGDVLVQSQARLDAFFLNSTFGGLAFLVIMYLLFQSIFTWAAPVMDGVEACIGWVADALVPLLPGQLLRDFTADALFGGIGAFLVFVPQIFVLTLVVGIMEDSGYMARAALICHRPLRAFGLSGKSFVPMLSGVACAIPAIYAARTVDSPGRRFLTYLAIPLMPCSARLPVYTLLIATFIPAQTALGGLVGLQGLAMFVVYFFGMLCGLLVTAFVSRVAATRLDDLPFILEMPPYRVPAWVPLLRNALDRSKHFITKAGAIIFSVTVVVWVLGYFPNYGADLGASWLGRVGQVLEPLFAPLGLDWRYAVAIISSFLAREVFVGTLGTMYGIEGADENYVPLVDRIQNSGLELASGVALLAFFAVALQCVSTLAILARETGSARVPIQMFAAYGVLAYVLAWIAYQAVGLLTG